MITTTLNRIRAYKPCADGWAKLLEGLGKTQPDDEPLLYAEILRINGLDGALWATRAEPEYAKEWRLFAVWCARRAQHLMKDPRSLAALDVAERYAHGEATDSDLRAAGDAAWDAALDNASAAAWGTALDNASAAAWGTTRGPAWVTAQAASGATARDAEREAQTAEFLRVVGGAK